MIQVEGNSVLAGVGVVEVRAPIVISGAAAATRYPLDAAAVRTRMVGSIRRSVTQKVDSLALAPFNANDLRTEGRQQTRRLWSHLQPGQVQHSHAVKRSSTFRVAVAHRLTQIRAGHPRPDGCPALQQKRSQEGGSRGLPLCGNAVAQNPAGCR